MNHLVHKLYAPMIQESRLRFAESVGSAVCDPRMTADEAVMFLIHFSSMGVKMTEPVEGWIKQAGERCEECGLPRLGRALKIHARHEANHHLMMIQDTRVLVARWNESHDKKLDADVLLAAPVTPGVEAYVRLHEDVIGGAEPFCQVAIEYEIEGLSVTLGPRLIEHCKRVAGPDILSGLTFVQEHVAVDAGHTLFNERELEKLLVADPGRLEGLARVGAAALHAYGSFLSECVVRAVGEPKRAGRPSRDAVVD
jgi:hypothetical protein